jgi:diguanylate cyclase (GGDEF)-like protein
MVVSDDVLFGRLARSKLEKWGHSVAVEHSGSDAFERIKKEMFRVVIMGWDLPGMKGTELCKRVRAMQRDRYIYLIFYTSKGDKETVTAALEAGADDFITLPFNPLELRLRIKSGKRLLNLEDELREGPGTDHSTGLVNNASFEQFFRVIIDMCRRAEISGVLMYIGIENYHEIYRTHGYVPANSMMHEIAKILRDCTRTSDLLAKTSANEFCMMLQNTYWEKCLRVAQKVTERIDGMAIIFENQELRPKATLESVNFPIEDWAADDILAKAERIQYSPGKHG